MLKGLQRLLARLRRNQSGNATLLMALGMPVLIGGSGLAVDTAMWYMWKRELQFATDQAALAGAWARTQTATKDNYAARATQEFNASIQATEDIIVGPLTVQLANYAGGNNNSVRTEATVSKELPFSGFITGHGVEITVYSQAAFTQGASFTSCIVALDEDESGAVTIGGTSVLTAKCGIASLSTSAQSIIVNGTPEIDAGYVLARGGIDDWFNTYTDDEIHEYMEGLYDPFASLNPPSPTESQVAKSYYCVKGNTTTRADKKSKTNVTYTYWKGSSPTDPGLTLVSNQKNAAKDYELNTEETYVIVENTVVAGTTYQTTVKWTQTNNGSGSNVIWQKEEKVVALTYSNISANTSPDLASPTPGTYTDIKVSCTTNFAKGVYVIDGGGLEIDGQYTTVGNGVMFVLKNGAYIKINGGSNINLTAMEASDLIAKGVSATDANKLAGMLVFEDRASSGTLKNNINGNAATVLNGTIYLPKSGIDFTGTATVTSQCLMIAANTIKISGSANMKTFCPASMSEDTVVATEISKVKLVV